MASENLRDGGDYRLNLSGSGLTNAVIDCETGSTLNLSVNMLEATCKGNLDDDGRPFKEFVPGVISWDFAVNLIIELGEAGVDVFEAITFLKGGDIFGIELSSDAQAFAIGGNGTINNVSATLNNNDTASGSLTLNGNGPLTIA